MTNIDYFHLLSLGNIQLSETHVSLTNPHDDTINYLLTRIKDHPYFCFAPKEFFYYSDWVYENIHYADYGYYMNDDEFDDDSIINRILTPIEELIPKFIFVKLEANDNPEKNTYNIIEQYDTITLFEYWLTRNRLGDRNQWKHLGLTDRIFNLLPDNHNYYDRNIICTCGHPACDNQEVWYIKYREDYSIPFVVELGKRLVFNLFYFDKDKWEPEDYDEELIQKKEQYRNFPFCFEYKSFKLLNNTIQPNSGLLSQ